VCFLGGWLERGNRDLIEFDNVNVITLFWLLGVDNSTHRFVPLLWMARLIAFQRTETNGALRRYLRFS